MAKKPHSWSKEFQKRRQMFAVEGSGMFEESEEEGGVGTGGGVTPPKSRRRSSREVAGDDSPGLVGMRRSRSPPSGGRESHAPPTSPQPPLHQHSVSTPWTNRPSASVITDRRHSSDSIHDREMQRSSLDGQRSAFDGNFEDDDDQLGPLQSSPGSVSRNYRQSSSHHRFLAAETGQKERVVSYGETTSPAFSSQSLSDDSEREDNALASQIAALTRHNQDLVKQLHDHEQERDRLRQQLETQRHDRGFRSPQSPSTLPSKLLDGRFLRETRTHEEEPVTQAGRLPSSGRQGAYDDFPRSGRTPGPGGMGDLLAEINALHRANHELEMRLQQTLEEKRRVESELARNRDVFKKVQEREQDLAKDIAILRNENSHHTGAVAKLSGERDRLQSTNAGLQQDLATVSEKLKKTEKCYKEVEQENLGLEADIGRIVHDKKQLSDELEKLQTAVEDALKTKENYRSTIKQLRDENTTLQTQLSKGSKERKVLPLKAEKPPRTLDEVMNLREEKKSLKDKLLLAQGEIESLEANLKAQVDEHSVEQLQKSFSVHLSDFHASLAAVSDDLESSRCDLVTLSVKQNLVMQEGFTQLAERCRKELASSQTDHTRVREALENSERSLVEMEEEIGALKEENARLLAQKASVTADVSVLRLDIATLQDQKRLLEVQVSQNDSLAEEKETKIQEMGVQQKKLQDHLATAERMWKSKFDRLDWEWQHRMAEADLTSGNLSEEVESLQAEKAKLEGQLSLLQLENKKLVAARSELESHASSLESRIDDLSRRLSENSLEISKAERSIARLLAEKACIVARLTTTQQAVEAQLIVSQRELVEERDTSSVANQELKSSLEAAQAERSEMTVQFSEISKRATKVDQLASQIAALSTENCQLRLEKELVNMKHETAVRHLQELSEKEQKLALEHEKVKMTLSTEIGLLKSKLKSVEDEKQLLEDELSADRDRKGASAFHVVSESKQVEQLKRQVVTLQANAKQQRGSSQEFREHMAQLSDLQARLVKLEVENKHLKDAIRSAKESADGATNLRKQVTELSRKTFFLESEKSNLTGKIQALQNSLKASREERSAGEHVKKLQEANQTLQDRLRALEESHTRKMMAADLKVLETVKQSDTLRYRLGRIQEQVETLVQGPGGSKEETVRLDDMTKSLRSESEILQGVGTSLAACREGLQSLEGEQLRIEVVQSEIQQALSLQASEEVSGQFATLSRRAKTSPHVLPPVLKALPPAYLSSLQGRSARPGSPTQHSGGTSNLELREKLSHMHSVNLGLAESLKKHQELLQQQEAKVSSLHGRFSAFESTLEHVTKRSRNLREMASGGQEFDLKPDQLQTIAVLQKQIENLQDQVIDRDVALQDIEFQMRKDYEMHDWKFTQLKSSVFGLREQLSAKDDLLRTKDQYIQQAEKRVVDYEGQLLKARKELERVLQERAVPGLPENVQMSDVIRVQGEEIQRLRKVLTDFSFDMSQFQSQLDSVQREKSVVQSKMIDMERMHMQMKEAMNADIAYLRRLNLQLVEQQMKAEKAKEVLQLVRDAQDRFKEQRTRLQLEEELDTCKVKIHEQERKISDLEREIAKQHMTVKILQVEKDHALLLNQHGQDMISPMPTRAATAGSFLRPRSADSARKPNYRISESFKSRGGVDSRNIIHRESEFSIMLPAQNSRQGDHVDILNLEEHSEGSTTLSLGPMVVTDDETSYSSSRTREAEEKASKPQRLQRLRMRGHRRSASSGSSILPHSSKDRDFPLPTATLAEQQLQPHPTTTKAQKSQKHTLKRPGSAGSTRPEDRNELGKSPEQTEHLKVTAQEVTKYMIKLIEDTSSDPNSLASASAELQDSVPPMKEAQTKLRPSGGPQQPPVRLQIFPVRPLGADVRPTIEQSNAVAMAAPFSQPPVNAKTNIKRYSEMTRSKPANKSTDSSETTSSEGGASGSSKSSEGGSGGPVGGTTKPLSDTTNQSLSTDVVDTGSGAGARLDKMKEIARTESMCSTHSSLSGISFGPGYMLPSRNHSFSVYDGGGESSPYSHESLEIGDSLENLELLGMGKLGYNPYMVSISSRPKHDTTSSSDEDRQQEYSGRRKRSSGAATSATADSLHETPHRKEDNSNSSYDSAHHFRGNERAAQSGMPVHRVDSISISDMEQYSTDMEVEEKVAALQKGLGRIRYSSTGSVKICYSGSTTSMEEIGKNP